MVHRATKFLTLEPTREQWQHAASFHLKVHVGAGRTTYQDVRDATALELSPYAVHAQCQQLSMPTQCFSLPLAKERELALER